MICAALWRRHNVYNNKLHRVATAIQYVNVRTHMCCRLSVAVYYDFGRISE